MKRLAVRPHSFVVLLAVALAACGGGAQMLQTGEAPVIRQGESMVVFMRPSALGMAISASVFDVSGPDTKFVGIVNYGTKVAYPVAPGDYTFMVVGESADFMQAKVLPGRTYHALVTPRPGVWKARFSFRPVRQHELDGSEFAGWSSATQFVENSDQTRTWAVQNAPDIASKRAQYWADWSSKPAEQRASQTLGAEDGKATAFAAAASPAMAAPALAAPAPALAAPAPAAPTSPVEPTASGVEIMFWESIRASTNPADFRAYLEQYPQGRFAALARNRLAALGQPAPAAGPRSSVAPAPVALASSGSRLPQQGDAWTYRLVEPRRTDGTKQREYRVKVSTVSNAGIVEQYSLGQGPSGEWTHDRGSYLVSLGPPLFSPYMAAFGELPASGNLGKVQIKDGVCTGQYVCQASARVVATETITVPAGTFKAIRVQIEHSWRAAQQGGHPAQAAQFTGARRMTVWYAPDAKRAVKFSSRLDFGGAPPVDSDFDLELLSYQLQ